MRIRCTPCGGPHLSSKADSVGSHSPPSPILLWAKWGEGRGTPASCGKQGLGKLHKTRHARQNFTPQAHVRMGQTQRLASRPQRLKGKMSEAANASSTKWARELLRDTTQTSCTPKDGMSRHLCSARTPHLSPQSDHQANPGILPTPVHHSPTVPRS